MCWTDRPWSMICLLVRLVAWHLRLMAKSTTGIAYWQMVLIHSGVVLCKTFTNLTMKRRNILHLDKKHAAKMWSVASGCCKATLQSSVIRADNGIWSQYYWLFLFYFSNTKVYGVLNDSLFMFSNFYKFYLCKKTYVLLTKLKWNFLWFSYIYQWFYTLTKRII